MKTNIYKSLMIAILLAASSIGYGQTNLSTTTTVVENFDAMGTSTSTPANWRIQRSASPTWAGGSTTGLLAANSGSPTQGGHYNWGTSTTERALGVMTSGGFASPTSVMGWYRNTNTSALNQLTISYDLERYRINTALASVQLYYSTDGSSWTAVTAGDISSTTIGTGTNAYSFSPQATFNVSSIVISGLNVATNGDIYLRWNLNTTGSNSQGIGIDNVSVTPAFATSGGTPTKLVVTSISPSSPVVGNTFDVTVQAQDNSDAPQNVSTTTGFMLSTNGNAGTIGGTTTGSIASGSNQVTVTGVTLSSAGTGVTLTATRTSGDNLTAGTSSSFTVLDVASQLSFVSVPSSGFTTTNLSSFTVEARRPDNSVDNTYTGNITVSKASGPGSLSGTTTVAAVAGVATFSTLQFDQSGSYTLQASASGLSNATSSVIAIAQTPVSWNFTTAAPSGGTPYANLSVSSMSQGNSNGAVTMLSSSSASSGYAGASGSNNAGVAARTGVLNTAASGSAYFEFTLTPTAGHYVTLNGISFGSRSTGTGPQAYTLLSSKDNYVSSVATGTLSASGSWSLYTGSLNATSSGVGSAITFRLYGHSGTGSPGAGTANWRIDDVTLSLDVVACTTPSAFTVTGGGSYCTGSAAPTVGLSGSQTGITYQLQKDGVDQGSPIAGTGSAISFGTQIADGNYTVIATNTVGLCTATMSGSATVTQNALPVINATSDDASVCVGSSTMIHATGGVSYNWMPGSLSGADNTVSPTSSTTYTVTGTDNNGCSNISTVSVGVGSCGTPYLQPAYCGSTLSAITQLLYIVQVPGATNYRIEVSDASQGFSTVYVRGGNIADFRLTYMNGIQYGRTYTIRVAAYIAGAWGAYGPSCTVNTPAVSPAPQLTPASCGITLTNLTQLLYYTSVPGASNYRLEVSDPGQPFTTVYTRGGNITDFRMSYINGVQYGRTYNIRVAAYVGGVWESYGSACTVTTPSAPASQLAPAYCGITLNSMTQLLYYTAVTGATNFRLEVSNAAQSFSTVYVRGGNILDFRMSYITGVQPGLTYDVRVAAYVDGGWQPYGPVCTVTTPSSSSASSENEVVSARLLENSIADGQLKFNVFPNPNNGVFTVQLEKQTQVVIYNALGETVMDKLMGTGNNEINLSEIPAGIYYVRAIGNKDAFRFIKQ